MATKAYIDSLILANRFYAFWLNIGTVPSSVESYGSDGGFITNVTSVIDFGNIYYTCTFTNPWGTADY